MSDPQEFSLVVNKKELAECSFEKYKVWENFVKFI
jgi:hypothetical protein